MSNLALPSDLASTLDDKYTRKSGRVFLTGTQALIRLPMLQRERDLAAGLNTAGFISGYRGSPLGNLDLGLWKAKAHLAEHHITFQPGINEDLAATAVWGSQQVNLFPGALYDGVFGLWYGKGPGVDRCGDVFRHANAAGSSKFGGVLVIAGDDHAAKSSTLPHQTEHVFKAVMMPVLYPANVQEYLDFGLHGWAMSRYSGCWVAFKALADTVETSASVNIDPAAVNPIFPPDFELPPDGLNIRWPDPPLVQEARLLNHKLYAALAYCRANGLNKLIIDSPTPKLGILTAGKSYLDVRQALDELGIDDALAAEIGIRLFKVGMVWPLEPEGVRHFAEGLEEILVVEEKRQLLEYQLKEELYNWKDDVRPRVIGKFDEIGEWSEGNWLLPATGELPVATIARVIAERIGRFFTSPTIAARLALIESKQKAALTPIVLAERKPHFCSGCPHNTSTRVPDGSRAVAGIGCHYMVTWMDRSTSTFTHMGGEGVPWIGQVPFTQEKHIFANLGDGTYFHSGLLAIRQAIAAKVPITYKILYNDAVAMTGGQPHDGGLTVDMIARQVRAEGVDRIAIVTDEPDKYAGKAEFPTGASIHHRDDLDLVQRELRDVKGVSVLIYDQTCAAEKRRRRKRGTFPDPDKRVFINELVCEGCGDCGVQSNCVSIQPVETEFGRKRRIDQSSCNKDFSCVNGFCPSFVTVHGGKIRKAEGIAGKADPLDGVPAAAEFALGDQGWAAIIDGVGGTGVVTIGAVLGMAAHLEGKGCGMIDMAGLAQKGGSVFTHVRIAATPEDIHAIRVSAGKADLVLGCDLVVSGAKKVLGAVREGHTMFLANTAEIMPGEFTRSADFSLPVERLKKAIRAAAGDDKAHFFDATRTATALFGNSLGANMFMLGFAFQHGGLPLSAEAVEKAIELNGEAVAMNVAAFRWGRRAAHQPDFVRDLVGRTGKAAAAPAETLDDIIARRTAFLTAYQNAAYGRRYAGRLAALRAAEAKAVPGSTTVSEAAARSLFKLMAIKDEYEVARLYTDGSFAADLARQFQGYEKLEFHLAPPILGRRGNDGKPRKSSFGPWMMKGFRLLAAMKGLRGTAFDLFGRTAERRGERQLLAQYEADLDLIAAALAPGRIDAAVALASVPALIRGYGHVRQASAEKAAGERSRLLERLQKASKGPQLQAAE